MAKETISQTEGLAKEAVTNVRNAYDRGYKQGYKDGQAQQLASDDVFRESCEKSAYEKGLNDSWECARRILFDDNLSSRILEELHVQTWSRVIEQCSASEAIQKIKEYEEKQKADSEVKVGDEVTVDERHFVVIGIDNGEWRHLWCMDNGLTYSNICTHDMKKTGKHFDQIAEVLEQLKEGQDEKR